MNLASLLAQFEPGATSHKISIPASWHQGRTSYGGLSSALAYQAAKLTAEDLPPLQSAQIAFVGPLAGDVEVQANILRRGKNTAFIKADIIGADGVGLTCTFIFMNRRQSHLDYISIAPPEFPPIPTADNARSGPPAVSYTHLRAHETT
jgi:acyl-CoA thioesterase